MTLTRIASQSALLLASLLAAASCSSDDDSVIDDDSGPVIGDPGTELRLNEVSHGFGRLLPHSVFRPGTNDLVTIRRVSDISENVYRGNPIQPTVTLPEEAIAPDGTPGNHYLFASFTIAIDPLEVLSSTGNGLDGAVTMTSVDSITGAVLDVPGRAFVGGQTLVLVNGQPQLQTWVTYDAGTGTLVPNPAIPEALGFPGVGTQLPGAETLASPSTITFVADGDGDLTSLDAFPSGVTLRLRATTALRAENGVTLQEPLLAATTVGQDLVTPELRFTPPPSSVPLITPGNGDVNVDPDTNIRLEFTEPVQPYSLGELVGQGPPLLSSAVSIQFGPDNAPVAVSLNVQPLSPFDLSVYEVVPGFAFPGLGTDPLNCGVFSNVSIALSAAQVEDMSSRPDVGSGGPTPNFNTRSAETFFETGEGAGLVNAPVAPDVILVGRSGDSSGMSVVDLNGFGQSTGNPIWSTPFPLEGETRFPYDPNVSLNPAVRPLLNPGECTIDGGSAGVFTLTLDSNLSDLVATAPTLSEVTDMHVAHALDSVFRNAPPPFGCMAGGGNVCALDGIKLISLSADPTQPNTIQPDVSGMGITLPPGYENIVSWAPHPNPPGLSFPPICVSPFLASAEPTTVDVIAGGTGNNLLVPGNPFPDLVLETPPTGLLTLEQNQFFVGPSFGQVNADNCQPHQIRQQVGHFLYVIDRPRNEVVVLNSNRMLVIDRIPVADPTSMAVGPNLDVLAVSNQLVDTVTFISIDPASSFFHRTIGQVVVGNSPRGLAIEPTNEDLLVCNELGNSVSIVSMGSLLVRRTVSSSLDRPFELAVTPRMSGFSFERGVYFGYILNRSGACAVFESGPNGTNGWGYDNVLGTLPFSLQAPKAIQVDPRELDAAVYVAYEGPVNPATGASGSLGEGAISRLHLRSALLGAIPLSQAGGAGPSFRDMDFEISQTLSQGDGQLSGVPVDLAFDNQRNLGGTRGPQTDFSAGSSIPANHKATVRTNTQLSTVARNTSTPSYLFAAVPGPAGSGSGVIDVLHLDVTGVPRFDVNPYLSGVQSIPAPGATVLCDYFRQ